MIRSLHIAPPNSLVLVEDLRGGEIPKIMGDAAIKATDWCIAVGCRVEIAGETNFVLADEGDVRLAATPRFEGEIATPRGGVAVRNVLGGALLECAAPSPWARVRIWLDDDYEPGEVLIAIS